MPAFYPKSELVIENVRPIALRLADTFSTPAPCLPQCRQRASTRPHPECAELRGPALLQGVFATTSIPVRLELAEGPMSLCGRFEHCSRAHLLVTRQPTSCERSLCRSRLSVALYQPGGQRLMHCNIIQLPQAVLKLF